MTNKKNEKCLSIWEADNNTPLLAAAWEGRVKMVKSLIKAGADVNAKNERGLTPLHKACTWGNTEVAKALIKAGADVNAKDKYGLTPLHKAADGGHAEVAIALIEAGADVNAKDKDDYTPLRWAQDYYMEDILNGYRALNLLTGEYLEHIPKILKIYPDTKLKYRFDHAYGKVYKYSIEDKCYVFCGNLLNRSESQFIKDFEEEEK